MDMDDAERLARRFEAERPHLRGVAYRMLGSLTEADDAIQDTWERVNRAGADGVENFPRLADDDHCPRVPEHVAFAQQEA